MKFEFISKIFKRRKNPFNSIGIWEEWENFDLFEEGINLTKKVDKSKTEKIVDLWKI